jgi:hypothetical protein
MLTGSWNTLYVLTYNICPFLGFSFVADWVIGGPKSAEFQLSSSREFFESPTHKMKSEVER